MVSDKTVLQFKSKCMYLCAVLGAKGVLSFNTGVLMCSRETGVMLNFQ